MACREPIAYQTRKGPGASRTVHTTEGVVASFCCDTAFAAFVSGLALQTHDTLFDVDRGEFLLGVVGQLQRA